MNTNSKKKRYEVYVKGIDTKIKNVVYHFDEENTKNQFVYWCNKEKFKTFVIDNHKQPQKE